MSIPSNTPSIITESATFIGIDYHKRYSIYQAIDAAGADLGKGRIEHHSPEDFATLIKRCPNPRVVFEASRNWHWLYEVLERSMPGEHITLANAFKTRIIAEAQVKTDKIDARILTLLLRAGLVSAVHIPCKSTRERKEVLRQRCFFVRQRTMLRNRIQRLLGAQHDLKLPQVSDLFGKKGLGFLDKLELPAPSGLLLKQQLDMLKNLQMRIKEDEVDAATGVRTYQAPTENGATYDPVIDEWRKVEESVGYWGVPQTSWHGEKETLRLKRGPGSPADQEVRHTMVRKRTDSLANPKETIYTVEFVIEPNEKLSEERSFSAIASSDPTHQISDVLLRVDIDANTDRSFDPSTHAETIGETDEAGEDEWKSGRGAVLHVNYDRDDSTAESEDKFDPITYDHLQVPIKENWTIGNEKDQMDLAYIEVSGTENLPANTKVYLRSIAKPPRQSGAPVSSPMAEVGAFHLYGMDRKEAVPSFTPLWGGRRSDDAPEDVKFDDKVEITNWVNKNASQYAETRQGASGPYRFAIEGLIYPGMKLGSGDNAEPFDGDIRIAVSIEVGNAQFEDLDVVTLGMPKQEYDSEGRAKCPQKEDGSYPSTAVEAHGGQLLPSFPGAEGFGRWSAGGRFGAVLAVTKNTDDGSPGTLRWALTQNVPRTVIVRLPAGTDGTIHLASRLKLSEKHPNLTLSGHSATPGLCLAGDETILEKVNNVLLRYMRFRPAGPFAGNKDALTILGESDNIVVDHCSTSWATDETLSVDASKRVTLQYNLIADSRGQEIKNGEIIAHNFGSLLRGADKNSLYSVHHNYWVHHRGRTPRLGSTGSYRFQANKSADGPLIDVRSNVMWNPESFYPEDASRKHEEISFAGAEDYYKWADENGRSTYFDAPSRYNLLNNHYWADGDPEMALLKESSALGRGYLAGNSRGTWLSMDQSLALNYQANKPLKPGRRDGSGNWNSESDMKGAILPALPSDVTLPSFNDNLPNRQQRTTTQAQYLALAENLPSDPADGITPDPPPLRDKLRAAKGVGASHYRDSVDAAILNEQSTHSMSHPALVALPEPQDADADAIPDGYETAHGLNKWDAKDANLDPDGNGYSHLEEYLETLLE